MKNSKQSKDQRGLKLYYIEQLDFVKEMRRQICETSPQTNKKRNIINLLAHYAKPELEGEANNSVKNIQLKRGADINMNNNALALEFLKLST